MASRKLQIFVSSTYLDLRDERQAVVETILAAGHIPAGMELFAADDKSQWKVIKEWIDECDAFVLILGGRYGTVAAGAKKSYVHREFEYATKLHKGPVALLASEAFTSTKVQSQSDGHILFLERERTQEHAAFRKLLLKKLSPEFDSIPDLGAKLLTAIRTIETRPHVLGWVRANDQASSSGSDPVASALPDASPLPSTALLRGRNDDDILALVDRALATRSSTEVASLARRHGWQPILDAGRLAGATFRRNYTYQIDITPYDDKLYRVDTTLRLRRTIPHDEPFISFVRTVDALRHDLASEHLVAVELVPVSEAAWADVAAGGLLSASFALGESRAVVGVPDLSTPDVVRFAFQRPASVGDTLVRVRATMRFVVPRTTAYFPVKLANVFCHGETTIQLRISDPSVCDLDAWVAFPGDVGLDPEHEGVTVRTMGDGDGHELTVSTSDEVLLWPGSGVVFLWRLNI